MKFGVQWQSRCIGKHRFGFLTLSRYSKPKRRSAFANRQDFGASWNDTRGGIVVSNIIEITIDADAILADQL